MSRSALFCFFLYWDRRTAPVHTLHTGGNRVTALLAAAQPALRHQDFLLQIEVSKIIVHEAGEPNAVVDFLDAEFLTIQHGSFKL